MATKDSAALFPLADHFATPHQQVESGKLGMWLFLATEILLFGGLFVGYAVFHSLHPELFKEAHKYLDVRLGALNTIVLLFSSLTVVLAIHAAQQNKKGWVIFNLAVTILCAFTFLVVKYFEYSHKIHLGLLPGMFFSNGSISNPDQAHIFFGIYFLMTGLHGIHVLIGMAAIGWIYIRMARGEFDSRKFAPVEFVGLYWHIVDLIWIFLFPLLYLVT